MSADPESRGSFVNHEATKEPRIRRQQQVAVIGASGAEEGSEAWRLAEEVGRRLAEAGVALICGGGGGVMEAASRAAAEAGGEWGTLSEIGFARVIGHEVVALRSWELDGRERMRGGPGVVAAETAEEAVAAALAAL